MAILRINQIDPAQAGALAGWPNSVGEIESTLPAGLLAFELRVVPDGSNGAEADARARVRQLLIDGISALAPAGEPIVVRVDGALTDVAAAIAWGLDKAMALSPVRRFSAEAPAPMISFRARGATDQIASLCDALGPAVGRDVRLRLFALPSQYVPPFLDIDDLDDERWPEIFAAASLAADTIANLGGLMLLTHRAADDLTAVLTDRLAR